ncbi:hypothetical protein AZ54_21985 [Xanthomonas oryzae pv. oryzae PXO86]|uniref:Uncharacterized protein n=1 Tax=Xanthomonas oryzae pv. oryzae (strain PXO99A) TaxID=360094 RepID=A0A0K0GH41_XANOP|nr:hypothetical protein PXO_05459 [Xanthomonas oryzae pv. oryzae PXO99A]AJQ85663.1 hypothetical protein AZ54_21985 [Xanthomonas oryzae pv. oryzae PXO86]
MELGDAEAGLVNGRSQRQQRHVCVTAGSRWRNHGTHYTVAGTMIAVTRG